MHLYLRIYFYLPKINTHITVKNLNYLMEIGTWGTLKIEYAVEVNSVLLF